MAGLPLGLHGSRADSFLNSPNKYLKGNARSERRWINPWHRSNGGDVIASDKNLKTIRLRGGALQPCQVPGGVIKGIGVGSRTGDGNG